MHWAVPASAAFVLGLITGCPELSPYACLAHADCDRGGQAGTCLADGACAYEDVACESDLRRSPNARVDPGECVPPQFDSSTTAASTAGDDTDPPTATTSAGSSDDGPIDCGSQWRVVVDTAVLTPGVAVDGYPLLVSFVAPGLVAAIEASDEQPFITDDDGSPLPHEWETIDSGNGRLSAWVRLPTYPAGDPVPLIVRVGVPAPANDPAAVWEGTYVGVWHLGDPLTGGDDDPMRNSVRVGEPGFTGGQMQPEQSVPGVVGAGLELDGVDDIVTVDASFVGQLQSYTVSFWARHEGRGAIPSSYFQRLNGDYFYPRCWRLMDVDGGRAICQYEIDDGVHPLGSGHVHEPGELMHLALVRDVEASRTSLYINGELLGENDDPAGSLPTDGHPFEIGHGEWGSFTGMLDEFRVSDRALPAAVFDADFRSQQNPASVLLDAGELQPAPCE